MRRNYSKGGEGGGERGMKTPAPDLCDLFRLVSTINLAVFVRLVFPGSDIQETRIAFPHQGLL